MIDQHPAEQYRQVMAELDADPPPPPPAPVPIAMSAPPGLTDWFAILRVVGPPVLCVLVAVWIAIHILATI